MPPRTMKGTSANDISYLLYPSPYNNSLVDIWANREILPLAGVNLLRIDMSKWLLHRMDGSWCEQLM